MESLSVEIKWIKPGSVTFYTHVNHGCTFHTHVNHGYSFYSSKIFIRLPKVLFATEELFQSRKHELATSIQAKFKGYRARKGFLRMRVAVIMIAKHWRRVMAKKLLEKRKWAAQVIRK